MGKLVRFNIGDGDFQRGFYVTLQIFEEGKPGPIAETEGRLPPAKEVTERYDSWRKYHRKKVRGRSSTRITVKGSTEKETVAEIEEAKKQLHVSVNNWLNPHNQGDFSPIWTEILKTLKDENEEIRVIVKTKNKELQQLPWYIWDEFFDYYRQAEVCLYLPVTTKKLATPGKKVKVLAVFGKRESVGNNTRIETEEDWEMLKRHLSQESNAELIRLDEPTLEELCEQIEEQCPQIFFFAGHSCSKEDGATGIIELNQEESITIDDLKPYLREAVDRGLQLAIFNSCEGLGIARQLAKLQIPNIIVMREPVPDAVAQNFLQRFLKKFASGKPLHIAVREAREKINHLERKFPGATWLPTLFQNPAEAPLTWQGLGDVEIQRQSNLADRPGEQLRTVNQSSIVSVSSEVNNISQINSIQNLSAEVRDISKYEPQQGLANSQNLSNCNIMKPQILGRKQMRPGACFIVITVMMALLFKVQEKVMTGKPVYTSNNKISLWQSWPSQLSYKPENLPLRRKLYPPKAVTESRAPGEFYCSIINKIPTTAVAHPNRGEVEFIRWVKNYDNQSPLENCRKVSARFQDAQEKRILTYIIVTHLNKSPAICASNNKYGPCDKLLFTVPPGYDPDEIVRHIVEMNSVPEVPPIEL